MKRGSVVDEITHRIKLGFVDVLISQSYSGIRRYTFRQNGESRRYNQLPTTSTPIDHTPSTAKLSVTNRFGENKAQIRMRRITTNVSKRDCFYFGELYEPIIAPLPTVLRPAVIRANNVQLYPSVTQRSFLLVHGEVSLWRG